MDRRLNNESISENRKEWTVMRVPEKENDRRKGLTGFGE